MRDLIAAVAASRHRCTRPYDDLLSFAHGAKKEVTEEYERRKQAKQNGKQLNPRKKGRRKRPRGAQPLIGGSAPP